MADVNPGSVGSAGKWASQVHRWNQKFPWLEVIGINLVLEHALPFIAKQVWKETEVHVENKQKKREAKVVFAEALGQLGASANPGDVAVFRCINDFMAVKMHGTPTAVADQEDFQANCVAIGGEAVQKTQDFLRALAKLPDHDMRMQFLDDIGFIGARAVDWREWVEQKGKDLFLAIGLSDWRGALAYLRDRGITVLGTVRAGAERVDNVVTTLDNTITAPMPAAGGGTTTLLEQSTGYRDGALADIGRAWRRR